MGERGVKRTPIPLLFPYCLSRPLVFQHIQFTPPSDTSRIQSSLCICTAVLNPWPPLCLLLTPHRGQRKPTCSSAAHSLPWLPSPRVKAHLLTVTQPTLTASSLHLAPSIPAALASWLEVALQQQAVLPQGPRTGCFLRYWQGSSFPFRLYRHQLVLAPPRSPCPISLLIGMCHHLSCSASYYFLMCSPCEQGFCPLKIPNSIASLAS